VGDACATGGRLDVRTGWHSPLGPFAKGPRLGAVFEDAEVPGLAGLPQRGDRRFDATKQRGRQRRIAGTDTNCDTPRPLPNACSNHSFHAERKLEGASQAGR
jgi:hypothetical protein